MDRIKLGYLALGIAFLSLARYDITQDARTRRRLREEQYQRAVDEKFENIMVNNYMT